MTDTTTRVGNRQLSVAQRVRHSWTTSVVVLLCRVSLGLYLLLAGIGKVRGGVGEFYENSFLKLRPEWLPEWFASPYGHAVPFLEILVGLCLILGFFGRIAALAACLMVTSFTIALASTGPSFRESMFFGQSGPFHGNVVFITLALLLATIGMGRIQIGTVIFGRSHQTLPATTPPEVPRP